MKNYYVVIVSVLHFSANSNEDFCVWKRVHRTIILPQGHDRLHLSCIASSGTILSVGHFGKTTFSNSKCARFFFKKASMSILPFLGGTSSQSCAGMNSWGDFTSAPLDCTKGGILSASYISKNRCIVLKHWKGKCLFFLMKCITLTTPSHWRPSNLGSVICKWIAYTCM